MKQVLIPKRLDIRSLFACLVVVVLTGCPQPDKVSLNGLRDQLLPLLFTSDTLAVIGDIPLYQGSFDLSDTIAVGDDIGSRLASIASGYGNERQVIIGLVERGPSDPWSDFEAVLVLHEYVHQADFSGLISHDLFEERLQRMRDDPEFSAVAANLDAFLDELSQGFINRVSFNRDNGRRREAIAYLIDQWASQCFELPDYMLEVYDGIIVDLRALDLHDFCFFDDRKVGERTIPPCVSGFYVRD